MEQKSKIERLPNAANGDLRFRLTIDRSEWLVRDVQKAMDHPWTDNRRTKFGNAAGGGTWSGLLLPDKDDKERSCCLGLICRAVGVAPELLREDALPRREHFARVPEGPLKQFVWRIFSFDSVGCDFVSRAAKINDRVFESLAAREAELVELFAPYGLEIVFTGELTPPEATL